MTTHDNTTSTLVLEPDELVALTAAPPSHRVIEQIPEKVALDHVVGLVLEEADCNEHLARRCVRWIDDIVGQARNSGEPEFVYHMNGNEWNRYHPIVLATMPDNTVSRLGSAHAGIEDYTLRRDLDEVSIIHSNRGGVCVFIIQIVRF